MILYGGESERMNIPPTIAYFLTDPGEFPPGEQKVPRLVKTAPLPHRCGLHKS